MLIDQIRTLIDAELTGVADLAQRDKLSQLLTSPELIALSWDYGNPGETFDCWRVGQSTDLRFWLVYCESGFGLSFPWGFVEANSQYLGNDSQWHSGLVDAAIGCGLLIAPPGYEVPGARD